MPQKIFTQLSSWQSKTMDGATVCNRTCTSTQTPFPATHAVLHVASSATTMCSSSLNMLFIH